MVDAAPRNPPTLATLLKRLADYGVNLPPSTHADTVAMVVKDRRLELVQCAGALIANKWQPAVTFERYYRELFGRELDGRVVRPRGQRRRA